MKTSQYADYIHTAARKILAGNYQTPLNEAKYGKDTKVVRALDIIQELEPGEQWGEFLQAMAEFVSAGYGDLSKQRGEDNPLGSQLNLRSWKQMTRSFERLADLEWGDDPEEEAPSEEPEGVEENMDIYDDDDDGDLDPDYVEQAFKGQIVTSDQLGNHTIEDDDGHRFFIKYNKNGSVESVKFEPRTDALYHKDSLSDAEASARATQILRQIQHRIVEEDTTAAAVAVEPQPMGRMVRRRRR